MHDGTTYADFITSITLLVTFTKVTSGPLLNMVTTFSKVTRISVLNMVTTFTKVTSVSVLNMVTMFTRVTHGLWFAVVMQTCQKCFALQAFLLLFCN